MFIYHVIPGNNYFRNLSFESGDVRDLAEQAVDSGEEKEVIKKNEKPEAFTSEPRSE